MINSRCRDEFEYKRVIDKRECILSCHGVSNDKKSKVEYSSGCGAMESKEIECM